MDNTEYNPADIAILTDAAALLLYDYRVKAEQSAREGLFASAAHAMRIAGAAARILATRYAGTPEGVQFAVRAAECEAAAETYLAQPRQ